jgi:aspartyl/glutamyl-tRNA(Asn/Gln) amidotransferase C subunit
VGIVARKLITSLTLQETKELAKVCKFNFNDEELIQIQNKINNILIEVKKLLELELKEEENYNTSNNCLRKDVNGKSLSIEEVFANTKNRDGDYFIYR